MARIRIDDDAKEKLEKVHELTGATKSGIASESIRRFTDELLDD